MDLYREIRQAARQLLSVPSFTLPAVLLLGLGLGAAIAMFSVVDAVLLRPLIPEQDRVVVLLPRDSSGDRPFQEISPPDFRDWRDAATSFQELAAFGAGIGTLSLVLEDGRSFDFRIAGVTPTFFDGAEYRGASLLDIAPTILYRLSEPVPLALDGKVLAPIFDIEWLSANPPRYVEKDILGDVGGGVSREGAEDVLERLRALGYIQ